MFLNCSSDDDGAEDLCLYRIVLFSDCECTNNEIGCTTLIFVLAEEKDRIQQIFDNDGTLCVFIENIEAYASSDTPSGYVRNIPSECISF